MQKSLSLGAIKWKVYGNSDDFFSMEIKAPKIDENSFVKFLTKKLIKGMQKALTYSDSDSNVLVKI